MTMHKALHPKDDTDRPYVSRKEGEKRLVIFGDCVDTTIHKLEIYTESSWEQKLEEKTVLILQATK